MPHKDFKFGNGWRENEFDVSRLVGHNEDDKTYLRILGMCYAKTRSPSGNSLALVLPKDNEDHSKMLEDYFASVLSCDETNPLHDYTKKKTSVIGSFLNIRNPNFIWYYYNPLLNTGPEQEKALLEGIVTTCLLDTASARRRHKVIFKTSKEHIAETVKLFSYLNKVTCSELDYPICNKHGKKVEKISSVWFYKPESLHNFIIQNPIFDELHDFLPELAQYPEDVVLESQNNLARNSRYKVAKETGRLLNGRAEELLEEERAIKKELNKITRELEDLHHIRRKQLTLDECTSNSQVNNMVETQKDIDSRVEDLNGKYCAVQRKLDEIKDKRQTETTPKRKSKKGGMDWYTRQQLKNQNAIERAEQSY